MITIELDFMGQGYRPYMVPKDAARSVEKKVDHKAFFTYDPVTLLHPEGVRGTYSIKFFPEGGDEFEVVPEPDTLYSPDQAMGRLRKLICSFGLVLYLSHRLFSQQPELGKIGFQ
jgi:hypothetical protein